MNYRTLKMFLYKQKLAMVFSFVFLALGLLSLAMTFAKYNYLTKNFTEFKKLNFKPAYYIYLSDEDNTEKIKEVKENLEKYDFVEKVIAIKRPRIIFPRGSYMGEKFSDYRLISLEDMNLLLQNNVKIPDDIINNFETDTVYAIAPYEYDMNKGSEFKLNLNEKEINFRVIARQSEGQMHLNLNSIGNILSVDSIFADKPDVVYIYDPNNILTDNVFIEPGMIINFSDKVKDNEKSFIIDYLKSMGVIAVYDIENMLQASNYVINLSAKRQLTIPIVLCIAAFVMFQSLTVLRFHKLKNRIMIFRILGMSKSKIFLGLNFWSSLLVLIANFFIIIFVIWLKNMPDESYWKQAVLFDSTIFKIILIFSLFLLLIQYFINLNLVTKNNFDRKSEE